MKRTEAPDSVGGLYVDKDPGVTVGTKLIAEDRNLIQEEICNTIEGAGATLSGADDEQLKKAVISLSHAIGEPVFNLFEKSPSVFFPAVRIDDADHDIDVANWPDLVPLLRAHKLKAGSTTDHSCTVAGSVVTFPDNADANALLAALAEEVLVHGGYGSWLSLNVGGTDYAITDIDTSTREVTVSGSPSGGAQTCICYPYRIAGSGTTARLRQVAGRALAAHDGDECLAGLRRRDRMQGHYHDPLGAAPFVGGTGGLNNTNAGSGAAIWETRTTTGVPSADGANGDPRTGETTDARAFVGYLYLWGGRYAA